MSSRGYATPLVAEPGRSRQLVLFWAVTHGAALLALCLLSPGMAFGGFVLLLLGWSLERGQLRPRGRLEWHADGHWRIATPAGRRCAALAPGSVCTPWLVVLMLREPGRRHCRVLCRDSLDPAVWRRLRVRLRIEGVATMHSPVPRTGVLPRLSATAVRRRGPGGTDG